MARFPIKTFDPQGYYCIDSSLIEVQFSETTEMVRYRITTFSYATDEATVYYGYWQPVRYDNNGRAYLKDWHGCANTMSKTYRPLYIDNFIRVNSVW